MNTKLKNGQSISLVIGNICFLISMLLRNYLSDFSRGFFEGMAIAFLTISAVLLVINTINVRKNNS